MKKGISVLLSLLIVLSACLGLSVSSFAINTYDIPGKITGTSEFAGEKDTWNMTVSFDKKSKTLTCVSKGKDLFDSFYIYLYSLSTDSPANQFVDRNNVTSELADTLTRDLFSVDPVRFGKIKQIILKRKDNQGTYQVAKYSFETKNRRVTWSTVTSPENFYSHTAQINTRYEYDKNGNISKIYKSNASLENPCLVEAKFSYDLKSRPATCTLTALDLSSRKLLESDKITYSKYNDFGWPKGLETENNVTGERDTDTLSYEFDLGSRLIGEGRWSYTYDGKGRLNRISIPHGNVVYSKYFII